LFAVLRVDAAPWPSNVLTPVGSSPVSPNASRSVSVKAVPRLMVGEARTALPRAWIRAITPSGLGDRSYGAWLIVDLLLGRCGIGVFWRDVVGTVLCTMTAGAG